jgi:hypothetical protein
MSQDFAADARLPQAQRAGQPLSVGLGSLFPANGNAQ